jgi:hypothetical protein
VRTAGQSGDARTEPASAHSVAGVLGRAVSSAILSR